MKTIKTKILLVILFAFCGSNSILNAQIEISSDGVVKIGTEPIFDNSTYFDLSIPTDKLSAVIRQTVGINTFGFPVNIGFEFTRTKSFMNPGDNFMVLKGLRNNGASIGEIGCSIYEIYSSYYYSDGSYLGVLPSSDANLKTNIRKLPFISEKILKLNPVTYDFVKSGSGEDVSKNKLFKDRTGFIAQEVKEIFPDLVVMGHDSLYKLDYAGLIPYLTKTIQELHARVELLENLIGSKSASDLIFNDIIDDEENGQNVPQRNAAAKTGKEDNINANILHQNSPNPFNTSTTIKYQLSNNATNAKICIYNLTGKQLQCHNLPATKGENLIEVRASSLQAGMYLYSLIVDDKLIATKRMILTE